MHYKKATLEGLIQEITAHNPNADIALIKKAYGFAEEKCSGILTSGGNPFTEHQLNTTQILAEMGADQETIVAALIHDTYYKCRATQEEIEREFGGEISGLIADLIKIIEIEERNRKSVDPLTLSKVIIATAKDLRAIFLELAARTEVLRVIENYPQERKMGLAHGSMQIYAPICHKLGLDNLEWELEDLSLKIIDRQAYNKIKEKICVKREVREKEMEKIRKEISGLLEKNSYHTTMQARVKNFFGIYKKIQPGKGFSDITDLRGLRIICSSQKECYEILGLIHSTYLPIPKEFHDYIANPKKNGYKSIHTCVYWNRKILEIQIRTWEMHHEAETGLSAHWKYKKFAQDKSFDKKLSWVKQLVDWQKHYSNSTEMLKSMKIDFGEQQSFVFTPKKHITILPEKATPVDFAFAVHSDLGMKCKQAKVNDKIVPLSHSLESGDTVEIITSPTSSPKTQWLSFVRSAKAKAKIRNILGLHGQAIPINGKKRQKGVKSIGAPQVKTANCCSPLPGDSIIGYRTTKRKITVHRQDCKNLILLPKQRLTQIAWSEKMDQYLAGISISAMDRPGLLNDILSTLAEAKAVINNTQVRIAKNNIANCQFSLKIKSTEQLEKIMQKMQKIQGIYVVSRK